MTQQEKSLLRELAHVQLETAHSEKNLSRVAQWKAHNNFEKTTPIIHIETGSFVSEVLPQRMQCQDPFARELERNLRLNVLNLLEYDDDMVVAPFYGIGMRSHFHPFGHVVERHSAQDSSGKESLGHQFEHWLTDLEDDWHKLQESDLGVDTAASYAYKEQVETVIGDILPVKMNGSCLYAVPTQQIVHLMSMENMFTAMYDYPDLFKKMMDRIAADYIRFFKLLEKENALLPTTDFQSVGQGTLAFTNELKSQGPLKPTDLWGFLDSQETVGISPKMFAAFIFPTYQKISQHFGLLSYGCCEPVDVFWAQIKTLPNLRKVSISPWCNQEFMANELRGKKMIFHRKPSPNYLGLGAQLDEDAFRAHIAETISTAKGCTLEITQRDVYSINYNVEKVRRYVEIIRQELEKGWQP